MKRFVDGVDRGQSTLFPECLEDWINEDNPVRVIDVFVEELDLAELGFGGVDPKATGAVTSTGYAGVLAGPAAVGFVSHVSNLPTAFWLLTALITIVPIFARSATRP
jgi:hypothetical protein